MRHMIKKKDKRKIVENHRERLTLSTSAGRHQCADDNQQVQRAKDKC